MQLTTTINQDSIRCLAYRLWEEGGRPEGMAEIHWLQAENQLHLDHRTATPRLDASPPKAGLTLQKPTRTTRNARSHRAS